MGPLGLQQFASVHPAGIYLLLFEAVQGQADRLPTGQQLLGYDVLNTVFGADRIAGQSLGQRLCDGCGHRTDNEPGSRLSGSRKPLAQGIRGPKRRLGPIQPAVPRPYSCDKFTKKTGIECVNTTR